MRADELEGDLSSVKLPSNLSEAINLRLAAVREADRGLDLLLRLTAVMGAALGGRHGAKRAFGRVLVRPCMDLFACPCTVVQSPRVRHRWHVHTRCDQPSLGGADRGGWRAHWQDSRDNPAWYQNVGFDMPLLDPGFGRGPSNEY